MKKTAADFPPIIVTPYEPPKPEKKAAAARRLDPEYANRKILALKAMLRDGDINRQQFDRLKAEIIASPALAPQILLAICHGLAPLVSAKRYPSAMPDNRIMPFQRHFVPGGGSQPLARYPPSWATSVMALANRSGCSSLACGRCS